MYAQCVRVCMRVCIDIEYAQVKVHDVQIWSLTKFPLEAVLTKLKITGKTDLYRGRSHLYLCLSSRFYVLCIIQSIDVHIYIFTRLLRNSWKTLP